MALNSLREKGDVMGDGTPRFSVIIPTYQRRHLVTGAVRSLAALRFGEAFEVIVVVDGSTDGTAEALRALDVPFPVTVLEQPNSGASRARNVGAAQAAGEILLFLDDDMEADWELLAEHDCSHREGAVAVVGHIPLHPDTPDTLLSRGTRAWAEERHRRLAGNPDDLPFDEIITGQLSVRHDVFAEISGFDERFTRRGAYGAEDVEFGHRLLAAGHRVAYNPAAVTYQRYEVSAAAHLRQYRQVGHADVALVRKHPELRSGTFEGKRRQSELHRLLWRPVLSFPFLSGVIGGALSRLASRLVDGGRTGPLAGKVFFAARAVEYWLGVAESGGVPSSRPIRVLNYHAIADLADDPVLAEYGVPPAEFRRHLDTLRRLDYQFLEPEELLRYLSGTAAVPKRAVLLTFDDCYRDLLDTVAPILTATAIPAIAFAVTGQLGGSNVWDQRIGARLLPLLGPDELATLQSYDVEVGAHSRSHRPLDRVPPDEIDLEVAGSVADLGDAGLGPVRFFAYPHGVHTDAVRAAARLAGVAAAFTVDPGRVASHTDRFALPRVEILASDRGWRFRWKVLTAGHRPAVRARLRHRLSALLR